MAIRKTEAGNFFLKIDRGSTNLELVNSANNEAVGDVGSVSTLKQTARAGVFGLDEITTAEETEEVFNSVTGEPEAKAVMIQTRTLR